MTTPAEELRAAAAKLRASIDNLSYPDGTEPWGVRPGSGAELSAVTATAHDGEVISVAEGAWQSTAVYIAAMLPAVGLALAAWLEREAFNVLHNGRNPDLHHALAVARALNGGQS